MGGNALVRHDIDVEGYWKVYVIYGVYLGSRDTGFTHSDFRKRRSIVGIARTTSRSEFWNTLVHELKHVQSDICMYYGVDEDSEDAAYLIGHLVKMVAERIL